MPRTLAALRSTLATIRMRSPAAWVGDNLEVCHENHNRSPRRRVLSRSRVNVERASLLRRESRRGIASWAAAKSCLSGLAARTHAHAARSVDFKNCCMISGEFDGSDRHYFFQRVASSKLRVRAARLTVLAGARPARPPLCAGHTLDSASAGRSTRALDGCRR